MRVSTDYIGVRMRQRDPNLSIPNLPQPNMNLPYRGANYHNGVANRDRTSHLLPRYDSNLSRFSLVRNLTENRALLNNVVDKIIRIYTFEKFEAARGDYWMMEKMSD